MRKIVSMNDDNDIFVDKTMGWRGGAIYNLIFVKLNARTRNKYAIQCILLNI